MRRIDPPTDLLRLTQHGGVPPGSPLLDFSANINPLGPPASDPADDGCRVARDSRATWSDAVRVAALVASIAVMTFAVRRRRRS